MMARQLTTYEGGQRAADDDEDEDAAVIRRQYLTFSMGGQLFALGIAAIKEILRNVQLAKVPLMPPHMRGVINLRGAVVPVIDLALLLECESAEMTRQTSVIVLEMHDADETLDIGILVDAVSAVIEIGAEAIEAPPDFGMPVRPDLIAGLGKLADGFVVILNAERTFALGRLAPALAE